MNRFTQICMVVLVVVCAVVVAFVLQPSFINVGAGSSIDISACAGDNVSTNAGGAILVEQSSGRVLWQQNAHVRLPMASTTKIFTALAVIENCNIYDVVEVADSAIGIEGSSIYLHSGSKLTVYDLLCGLMLRSGNDSAVALALHCGGSVEGFCDIVNNMVADMGLVDTNITNPHGLHDNSHYTTAYDLSMVSSRALSNETFAEIVSSKSAVLHYLDNDTNTTIYNKNKLLSNYDGADGVKTGYTTVSGRCFVGSATRNGMQLVSVVLDCYNMWEDSPTILDYGYNNYTMTNIVPQNAVFSVRNGTECSYYTALESFDYPINCDESDRVNMNIVENNGKLCCEISINSNIVGCVLLTAVV